MARNVAPLPDDPSPRAVESRRRSSVTAGRERSGRERSGRERSGRERSGRERSGRERSGRERSGRERSGRERSGREREDREREDREREPKKRKKKKKNPVATIISVLFILAGIAVMVYPVAASQINNIRQGEMAALQREEIAAAKRSDPKVLEEGLAAAHEYNVNAPSVPVSDPWSAQDHTEDNPEYSAYLEQLNDFSTMGTVTIPTINSSMPIYHGTAPSTLDKGVGHLHGTSLPVGGNGTHSVLTAHTGLRQATAWDNLIEVTEGDEIFVEVYGETMKYQVYDINVVLPTDTDALMFNDQSRELLTLITCTPYGVNSHRLLVHAESVELTAADREMLKETSNFAMQWWMWLVIVVVALLLAWVIWQAVRAMRKK